MKSTQGAGLIGDEALDFLAILSLPLLWHSNLDLHCLPSCICLKIGTLLVCTLKACQEMCVRICFFV